MRLIDADKIEKFIEDGLNCKDERKRFGHDAIEIMTEIHYAPTISLPPNDPLTLDELREVMNNDWVWVRLLSPVYNMKSGYYVKTRFSNEDSFSCGYPDVVIRDLPYSGYSDIWIVYHHKPEEGI